MACAIALELGDPLNLVHGNHLLYGWAGYEFWKFLLLPLGVTRGLFGLQIFTSFLSAVGLAGLYRLLEDRLHDKVQALLLTGSIAVFAAFWVLSIEPNPYALGFLGLAWAAYFLLRETEESAAPIATGFFHGIAVLGHITHLLWVVPALYALWTDPRLSKKKEGIAKYLLTLALTAGIPYLWVMGFIVGPHYGFVPLRLWRWFLGTVAIEGGVVGKSHWNFPGARFFTDWIRGSFDLVWGTLRPYGTTHPSLLIKGLTVLSFAMMAFLLGRSYVHRRERLWRFSMIWLGVYALFFFTWEPNNTHYRMGDVIPLALLMGLGTSTFFKSPRFFYGFTGLLLALLLAVNLQTRIAPMHQLEQNTVYTEVRSLALATDPHSLYLTAGGTRWLYLLYFSGRKAWDVADKGPQSGVTEATLRAALREGPVYVCREALDSESLQRVLRHFHLMQLAENGLWSRIQ